MTNLTSWYIPERLKTVDPDFLSFEEDLSTQEDRLTIWNLAESRALGTLPNPHNSILLYVTGLTDDFDPIKARVDTTGGSPPDIDIDFESLNRDKAIAWVINKWGQDNVANIITHGTFKPKSLTRRYFKITEEEPRLMQDILEAVPKPLFGKEATLAEIIQGNEDKNYEPHPRLATDGKYKGWYKFASQLEGMITNFGIHAGGVVISDFPIYEQVPMWKNSKSERITQFDMHEVEDLGLIKFDFLGVNNIDIIKEACRLVGENHGITLDPYQIPDHDKRAYALLNSGLLCGIFQMETSGSARDLIMQILPTSIEDLSDISALNRPGPLENHFHTLYMENKANGYAPEGINEIVADITKSTHYTIIYQEQVMAIVSRLAGFTLREADDVRRAMG